MLIKCPIQVVRPRDYVLDNWESLITKWENNCGFGIWNIVHKLQQRR